MTRSITRQIEPEWDDATRRLVEGLAEYLDGVCECGLHESILEQPDLYRFTFRKRVCKVCAAQAAYARILADQDEKYDEANKLQRPGSPRPSDGRHVGLSPMTPDEIATVDAQPVEDEPMRGRKRRRPATTSQNT